MADEFGNLRFKRPRFTRHFDGNGVMLQTTTGRTQPRPMHTGAAIELPTAATNFRVCVAVIAVADGAGLHADRADGRVVDVTSGNMLVAQLVFAARLRREMVGAERLVTEVTLAHAIFTPLFATLHTGNGVGGKLPTTGTFLQTIQTIGFAAGVALKEAGANLSPADATGDQAIVAEALSRRGTDAKLRAVLLATWATNGTISTYERMRAVGIGYGIGA